MRICLVALVVFLTFVGAGSVSVADESQPDVLNAIVEGLSEVSASDALDCAFVSNVIGENMSVKDISSANFLDSLGIQKTIWAEVYRRKVESENLIASEVVQASEFVKISENKDLSVGDKVDAQREMLVNCILQTGNSAKQLEGELLSRARTQ